MFQHQPRCAHVRASVCKHVPVVPRLRHHDPPYGHRRRPAAQQAAAVSPRRGACSQHVQPGGPILHF